MQINIVWSFSNECAVLVRGSVSLIWADSNLILEVELTWSGVAK
jgi:hypothetical protein